MKLKNDDVLILHHVFGAIACRSAILFMWPTTHDEHSKKQLANFGVSEKAITTEKILILHVLLIPINIRHSFQSFSGLKAGITAKEDKSLYTIFK